MLASLWNFYSPFGLFKDASRGSFAERAAAYRHNVDIRGYLLPYIQRWILSGAAALLLTGLFESMSPVNGDLTIFVVLAAADAVFASLAACAVCVLTYSYASLSYHAAQLRDASHRR
jgi:hypothetical protein